MADETPNAGNSHEPEGTDAPKSEREGRGWPGYLAVAMAAAVIASFAAANWHSRIFSFVVGDIAVNAGLVILMSAGLGFVLAWAFFWSASGRR